MRKAHNFVEKDSKRCYTVFRNLSCDSVQVDISIQNTAILFNSCEHKYFVHNSNNNQEDYYNRNCQDCNKFNAKKSVWILILIFFADSFQRLEIKASTMSGSVPLKNKWVLYTLFKNNSLSQFYFPGLFSLFLIHT